MATRTQGGSDLGEVARTLNEKIDCSDLAERLSLRREGAKGNYHSPHHEDKTPSVSVYRDKKSGLSKFMDYSIDKGGGPVDMLMWHSGLDFVKAVKELAGMFGVPIAERGQPAEQRQESLAEFIAGKCKAAVREDANPVFDYLQGRGVGQKAIEHAIERGSLGLNLWSNPAVEAGKINHGGAAAAFLVKDRVTTQIVAVDMRYFDAELNGGQKTMSQGEKVGFPWCSDWRRLESARTVYVVESSINALSIESCVLPGSAAVATRGTGNVARTDWSFLRGKSVIACFDNDKPLERGPDMGYSPGAKAAWLLHEILTGLDISCQLVDQSGWFEDPERKKPIKDINDFLKIHGWERTTTELRKIEEWAIPGVPAEESGMGGKRRLYFPGHDYHAYTRYRVQPDFTRTIEKTVTDEEGGKPRHIYNDVCGFRIAAVSRVQIASDESAMTGTPDHSPQTMFALTVQTPADGPVLQRMVVDRAQLRNLEVWKRNGFIFAPTAFSRLVSLWERAAGIGERDAVNFVGLAWRNGKPVVNEGADCFFTEPSEQCPYHGLTFPSGRPQDAGEVLEAFQRTFKANAAAIPFVWALGAHLKAFLGFWPHFVLQAEKGAGKTVVVKAIGRAIAMAQFSRQTLGSEYRIIGSISYTSHPVGWGEFSTLKQDMRAKAVASLQESYGYEATSRGMGLKRRFLLCAPVLLSGEDVPVDALEGKLIRSTLTQAGQGEEIGEKLPHFPVKEWLRFLCSVGKQRVRELHAEAVQQLADRCAAQVTDAGAKRMMQNYGAVLASWLLLREFMGVPDEAGAFVRDLATEMNTHINESKATRQPWVSIIEKLLSEIASRNFRHPFEFGDADGVEVLYTRTSYIMAHIQQSNSLRDFYDEITIKSPRVLKQQLVSAGVVDLASEGSKEPKHYERSFNGRRESNMVALIVDRLKEYGLHPSIPIEASKPEDVGGSSTRRYREEA
jgi:hypothetical protein